MLLKLVYVRVIFLLLLSSSVCAQFIPDYQSYRTQRFTQILSQEQVQLLSTFSKMVSEKKYQEATKGLNQLLEKLGFQTALNLADGYIQLKHVPKSFKISKPLNAIIQHGGYAVAMVKDRKFEGKPVTSFADHKGIYLDFNRFLTSLYLNSLGATAHEATHYFHLNNIGPRGQIAADKNLYKSKILLNNPSLFIYKNGFGVTEIDSHIGDAFLFQDEDPSQFSYLNSHGKFAFSYMLSYQLFLASEKVIRNITASDAMFNYTLQKTLPSEYGDEFLYFPFLYTDPSGNRCVLFLNMPKETNSKEEVLQFLRKHSQYALEKMNQIESSSGISSVYEAQIIAQSQIPNQ